VFRALFPNQVIRANDLARAMVDVAVGGTEERQSLVFENRVFENRVFENSDIRALVESFRAKRVGG